MTSARSGRIPSILVLALATVGAVAQEYPTRVIRWVVPYAAGGGTDTTARNVAPLMSAGLGQQVIIDNRPGGAANPSSRFGVESRTSPASPQWTETREL